MEGAPDLYSGNGGVGGKSGDTANSIINRIGTNASSRKYYSPVNYTNTNSNSAEN
jgi:hypothetical protein